MPEGRNGQDKRNASDNPAPTHKREPVAGENETGGRAEKQDSADRRPHWADILMAVFTGLILLAYLTSDYFLWKQLALTQEALTDSESSFAKTLCQMQAQTQAQNKAAGSTVKAADAAQQQVAIFRAASYESLRPYVSVTKMEMLGELKEGRTIKGHAEMINSGKTPAVRVGGCSDITLLPDGSPITDDFPCPAPNNPKPSEREEISKFTLGTGAPYPIYSRGITISPVDKLMPMLVNGGLRLYFYGDLTYGDILNPKVTHHLTFCGRYNLTSNSLVICEKHNGMD